jgi:hypothetical protein
LDMNGIRVPGARSAGSLTVRRSSSAAVMAALAVGVAAGVALY